MPTASRLAARANHLRGRGGHEDSRVTYVELFYDRAADAGYEYGPAFRGLRRAYRDGDAWYAEVALDGEHESQAAGFCVHPALADAALHTLLLAAFEPEATLEPAHA